MSYGASICSYRNKPPPAPKVFREQRWLPDTIMDTAPSQRELEIQLVMDRLLREYLSPRSPRE